MNIKRTLVFSSLAYISSLAIGYLISLSFGINPLTSEIIPKKLFLIQIFFTCLIIFIFTFAYLEGRGVSSNSKEGLLFSAVVATLWILVESFIFFTKIFFKNSSNVSNIYLNLLFWITIVIVLLTGAFAGAVKKKLRLQKL